MVLLGLLSSVPNLPAWGLELPEVLSQLRDNYPPLQAARLKVEQTRGKWLAKQGAFDTKLKSKLQGTPLGYYQHLQMDSLLEQPTPWWGATVFSGYRLGLGHFADYDGKKETLSLGEIRTGLQLPLLRNGSIDLRRTEIAVLGLQVQMAELELFQKQLKFSAKALKAYWTWVAARRKIDLAQKLLALAQTRVAQLQSEIQLGKKPPVSALENQRALLKRQNKILDLQREEREAALELSLYLRGAHVPSTQEPASFPEAPLCAPSSGDQVIQQALQQRPEVLILQLQQEQNQLGLDLAHNQLLPDLGFFLTLSQDLGEGSKSKAPFELETGLSLEWPLQMRKERGQVAILEAEAAQLHLQTEFAQNSIRMEIAQALMQVQNACGQMELAERESKVAAQLAAAEWERFELGSSTLFVVNKREQAASDAQMRLVEAQKAYYLAEMATYLSRGLLPQQR